MNVVLFFFGHWYASLFFQTLFHHRYSAHKQFTMSKFWEKAFFLMSYLFQNSSYLSPWAYGIMHRQHHAFADTKQDPHSPKFSKNLWTMMWDTKIKYSAILKGKVTVDQRFLGDLPKWMKFDLITDHVAIRALWIPVYIGIYYLLGASWWMYLTLFPIQLIMGPFHGAIINWFAHKIGYRNYEVSDTSMNILPVDVLMLGEGYHNNHHKNPNDSNFGSRWFELDPVYPFIKIGSWLGIFKMTNKGKTSPQPDSKV